MGDTSDIRVIYLTHPSRGVPAPELMVRFHCPVCGREAVIDAFLGVPVCGTDKRALEGISVIRPPQPQRETGPTNDISQRPHDKSALSTEATDKMDAVLERGERERPHPYTNAELLHVARGHRDES